MGTRIRPVEAYRFARGGELGIQPFDSNGQSPAAVSLVVVVSVV